VTARRGAIVCVIVVAAVALCSWIAWNRFLRTDSDVTNRTDAAITDVELIGSVDTVRIDRLAPNETRRVAPPRGGGFDLAWTDDGGRWTLPGGVYVYGVGFPPPDVVIGPGGKVNGQPAERVR
jgi:hypothetical protein